MGVNAAAMVDLTDIAAENLRIRHFDGNVLRRNLAKCSGGISDARSLILLVIFSIQFGQRDVVQPDRASSTRLSRASARPGLGYGIYLLLPTRRPRSVSDCVLLHGMFENEMR